MTRNPNASARRASASQATHTRPGTQLLDPKSCVATRRFIVMDSVADAFLQRFAANVAKLKVGNPAERTTDVGPLARDDLRDALDRQVRESVAQGGRLLLGGYPIARPGYFYAPTILADVTPKEDTNRRWARLGKARSAFALSNLSALLVGGWIAGLG